jgi:ABC-2 type transport system permease protein
MREIVIVLNMKATSFLKRVFEFRLESFAKDLSSFFIFGSFAVGVFMLSRATTLYLLQEAHIGQFLFHRFLSMLLYVFFVTVNLGNMIVSYATLYRSEEVTFLMSLPISHEKIFVLRFIDNFFYSSSTLSLIGFAVLLGYGSCFDLPWYFYFFTMFFVMGPFLLIAGILAVLLLMSLIKIATRIGVRRLLGIIVTIYLSAIYAYFKIVNPVQLTQEVMKYFPDVNQYFGNLDPPLVTMLPNHWASEFLYWSIAGEFKRAVPYFALLFLTMLGLMVIAALVSTRYYYQSWLVASDSHALKPSVPMRIRLRVMEFGRRLGLSPQMDVILKRDFWLFLREPSQWLHLILMVVLMFVFLVSVGALELKLTQPFLQTVAVLIVFLFDGFLVASITLRFVFPSVSLEGDAFWSVRSSPVSLKKLYWQKFAIAVFLVLPVALILSFTSVSILRGHSFVVLATVAISGIVAVTLTSINLGAGTYFALFREKNPIRVASSQGASLTFLGCMIYLALVVALMLTPLNNYFRDLIISGRATAQWMAVPVTAIFILSCVLILLSTGFGLKAFNRDF